MTDYTTLVRNMVYGSASEQESARITLYQLDEDAVTPLIDEFYAGVNEATGLSILAILIEIGGYEVRAFLEDLLEYEVPYPSWHLAIKKGLGSV